MGAAAVAAIPLLRGQSAAEAATPKNILVMAKAMDDVVFGFDPAEADEFTSVEVCCNLYRSLITVDQADPTRLVGDLASKWEVSQDGLVFKFHLGDKALFESGKPVTAADAAFSLQRVVKLNASASRYLTQFGWTSENVDGLIRAEDVSTLSVKLPSVQASGIVLAALSAISMVVEKAVATANETHGDFGNAWLRKHSAGSGSYRLVEWLPSDRIVLTANPNAFRKPNVPRLVIRHIADSATQSLQLKKGDVDIARDLGFDQLNSIANDPAFKFTKVDSLNQTFLTMNMGVPQFKNPKVFQAIKWSIDYIAIAKNITGNLGRVTQSFLPKGMPSALTSDPFSKDVAKAKALLAEAGFPHGFSVTLDHYAKWPYADVAQAIQADLADIGINVTLIAGEKKQVLTKWRARKHEMLLGSVVADYLDPNALAQDFLTNADDTEASKKRNPAWFSHYADRAMTNAANAAAVELDDARRRNMYQKIQEKFLAEAPFAYVLQHLEVASSRAEVHGLVLGALINYTRYDGTLK